MFVAEPDTTCLRQGDVLANVPFPQIAAAKTAFLGAASLDRLGELAFTAQSALIRDLPMYTCQVQARIGFAIILSQCCDLAPRDGNRIEQPSIALARLAPIPASIRNDAPALADLQTNSDPRLPEANFLNLFYIPARPEFNDRDWMVDFGQVFSIPSQEFPAILRRKVLQMDDDFRIRFKIRLSASFARFTDEELAAGHPWFQQVARE